MAPTPRAPAPSARLSRAPSLSRSLIGIALVSLALVVAGARLSTALARGHARSSARMMPGPTRARVSPEAAAQRARVNADCVRCHADIAAEWRDSLHRRAHTDPVYARAYAREPTPFCKGCHAPESDPRDSTIDERDDAAALERAAALGVACVTCHAASHDADGTLTVLAGPARAGPDDAGAAQAHALLRAPAFARAEACAGCHEFVFPDGSRRRRSEWMQKTVREHRRSAARERACADCHMPIVDGPAGSHRSHRFAASRDPEVLRGAVEITARCEPRGVTLTLTPARVGHAFPTGDLFRRLELALDPIGRAGADDEDTKGARRYLARHFTTTEERPGKPVRTVLRDDRVGARPGPTVVTLTLPGDVEPARTRWRVSYQRVEHLRGDSPQRAVVEGEIELAAGRCERPSSPTR